MLKGKDGTKKRQKKGAAAKVVTGLAMGTAVGLTAGILLAPKSGKETRKEISEKAKDVLDKSKEDLHNIKYKIAETVEDVRDDISSKAELLRNQ